MASVRNALFLLVFVVVVGKVHSAAFQPIDYKHRSSVWSAKMSPIDMLSLLKNGNEDKAGASGVKGCCVPDTFTATLYERTTEEESRKIYFSETIISRDLANKRLAEDFTEDNVTTSTIALCTESGAILYVFTRATKQCTRVQWPKCPINPGLYCFSSNGTLDASFSLGAGPGALDVQVWGYSSAVYGGEVIISPDNCVPVATAFETRAISTDTKYISAVLYTDVTLSISDPSVFVPPPYCDTEEDGETLTFDRPEFDIRGARHWGRFAPFR